MNESEIFINSSEDLVANLLKQFWTQIPFYQFVENNGLVACANPIGEQGHIEISTFVPVFRFAGIEI